MISKQSYNHYIKNINRKDVNYNNDKDKKDTTTCYFNNMNFDKTIPMSHSRLLSDPYRLPPQMARSAPPFPPYLPWRPDPKLEESLKITNNIYDLFPPKPICINIFDTFYRDFYQKYLSVTLNPNIFRPIIQNLLVDYVYSGRAYLPLNYSLHNLDGSQEEIRSNHGELFDQLNNPVEELKLGTPDGFKHDPSENKKAGEISYTNGSKYKGEINYYINTEGKKCAQPNGHGELLYKSGDKYAGLFKNGLKCGEGMYTFADGTKYSGIWTNDKNNAFDIAYAIKTKRFSQVNPHIKETITDCSELFEKVQKKSISVWNNCNLINPTTLEKFEFDEKIFFIKTTTNLLNPKYEVSSVNDLLQKMVSSVESKLNYGPILSYNTTSLTRTCINNNNLVECEPTLRILESVINATEA
jgi:hypothetical protein